MTGLASLLKEYNTRLSPQEEARFAMWAAAQNRMGDLEDYDLRGAWKADAQAAQNGHLPDTWKKPNHPTFSAESQYSTPQNPGGSWQPAGNDQWTYWASPANLQYRNATSLADYFKQVEPTNTLVLPFDYRLPRR